MAKKHQNRVEEAEVLSAEKGSAIEGAADTVEGRFKPLTSEAFQYWNGSPDMQRVFTWMHLKAHAEHLGHSMTLDDIKLLFGVDESIPAGTGCGFPGCDQPVLRTRAAIILSDGSPKTDREGKVVYRGSVVVLQQKDRSMEAVAFCHRHLKDVRVLPNGERLPAQSGDQAAARADGINAKRDELKKFWDSRRPAQPPTKRQVFTPNRRRGTSFRDQSDTNES